MAFEQRPFTLTETQPMTYVALVADYTGRYAHVYGNANSWANYIDQLEDIGCEVIENQTDDYEIDPSENLTEYMEECGVIPIASLFKAAARVTGVTDRLERCREVVVLH